MKINEITKITPEDDEFYRKLGKYHGVPMTESVMMNFAFVNQIKEDCQPYLKEMDNLVFSGRGLWRGMDSPNKKLRITKTTRLDNRIPKDMPQYIHDKLNEYFDRRFGHPYRNGVFATGPAGEYFVYGEAYQIFPIGNFDYIWSMDIEDLMGTLGDFDFGPEEKIVDLDAHTETMDRQIDTFIKSKRYCKANWSASRRISSL